MSVYTLNQWTSAKDILSIHELTRLSDTLPYWYGLFLCSLVEMGSAADVYVHLRQMEIDLEKYQLISMGKADYAIAIGTYVTLEEGGCRCREPIMLYISCHQIFNFQNPSLHTTTHSNSFQTILSPSRFFISIRMNQSYQGQYQRLLHYVPSLHIISYYVVDVKRSDLTVV